MNGRQYIYGVQVGVTYKFFENKGAAKHGLSMHLGARMNFASNHYEGYLRNIKVNIDGTLITPAPYFEKELCPELRQYAAGLNNASQQASQAAEAFAQAGNQEKAAYFAKKAAEAQAGAMQLEGAAQKLSDPELTADKQLDCDQKGWGIAPIIGLDYRVGNLNIGARYEFQTNMNIENKTTVNTTGVESFAHGVNTPNDIPGILAIGAQYQVLPKWRLMAGWNCYFDKKAGMSGGKQKTLTHNTHEITVGTEVDVVDRLTLSGGFQNTDYGLSDDFQSDLSFSCDSYSLGFGLKVKITKKWTANAAYFWTTYKDYTKASENYNGTGLPGVDVYSRTNKVFGVGITYDL